MIIIFLSKIIIKFIIFPKNKFKIFYIDFYNKIVLELFIMKCFLEKDLSLV